MVDTQFGKILLLCTQWALAGFLTAMMAHYFIEPTFKRIVYATALGPFYLPAMMAGKVFYWIEQQRIPKRNTVQDVRRIQQTFREQGIKQPDGPFSAWAPAKPRADLLKKKKKK